MVSQRLLRHQPSTGVLSFGFGYTSSCPPGPSPGLAAAPTTHATTPAGLEDDHGCTLRLSLKTTCSSLAAGLSGASAALLGSVTAVPRRSHHQVAERGDTVPDVGLARRARCIRKWSLAVARGAKHPIWRMLRAASPVRMSPNLSNKA